MITKVTWNKADFNWDKAPEIGTPYTWDLVQIIEDVVEEITNPGGANIVIPSVHEDKKKKVIRLVMYRKNIKVYDEKKEVKNIKNHIEDIKLIAEELKRNVQIIHR